MMTIDITKASLGALCELQLLAKVRITQAQDRLAQISGEIANRMRMARPEDPTSIGYTIAVDHTPHFKMLWPLWTKVKQTIPEAMRPTRMLEAFQFKRFMWMRHNEPQAFEAVLPALQSTPQVKVTVTRDIQPLKGNTHVI